MPHTLIEHHCRDRFRAVSTNAQRHEAERHAFSRGHEPSAIAAPAATSTSPRPLSGARSRIDPVSNPTEILARRAASSSVAV
ncbi:MAG TPA: hypothetical protein VLW05_04930, partial [Gaiellaceae bacterium]|nr:hypothetical protein [Gaiellaceae bacterium]